MPGDKEKTGARCGRATGLRKRLTVDADDTSSVAVSQHTVKLTSLDPHAVPIIAAHWFGLFLVREQRP